jgi:hypothetical protein
MAGERGSAGILEEIPPEVIIAVGVEEAELYANSPQTDAAEAASRGDKHEKLVGGKGYEVTARTLGGSALFGEQRSGRIMNPDLLFRRQIPVTMGAVVMNVLSAHRRRR